jgi:hypothetical protein
VACSIKPDIEDSLSLISFDDKGNPFVESKVHASSSVVPRPAIIDYLPAKMLVFLNFII